MTNDEIKELESFLCQPPQYIISVDRDTFEQYSDDYLELSSTNNSQLLEILKRSPEINVILMTTRTLKHKKVLTSLEAYDAATISPSWSLGVTLYSRRHSCSEKQADRDLRYQLKHKLGLDYLITEDEKKKNEQPERSDVFWKVFPWVFLVLAFLVFVISIQ